MAGGQLTSMGRNQQLLSGRRRGDGREETRDERRRKEEEVAKLQLKRREKKVGRCRAEGSRGQLTEMR